MENCFLILKGISPLTMVPVGSSWCAQHGPPTQGSSPSPFRCSAFKPCLGSCLLRQTSTWHVYFFCDPSFYFLYPVAHIHGSHFLPASHPDGRASTAFVGVSKDQLPAETLSQTLCRISANLLTFSVCLSLPQPSRIQSSWDPPSPPCTSPLPHNLKNMCIIRIPHTQTVVNIQVYFPGFFLCAYVEQGSEDIFVWWARGCIL